MSLFIPNDSRPVHFMGIAGAGMSALALIAMRRGVAVTGCDNDPSGAKDVVDQGVAVTQGHDPNHVDGVRAVVYTAAVPPDHPELAAARAAGIPVFKRAAALQQVIDGGRTVAIAGTHGKTTTTAMVALALEAIGLDPTALVGGRVSKWKGNARLGAGDLFVVEADEYDRSFLELYPEIAVVNNVEADHLECYGSVESLEAAFAEFAGRAGRILTGADDGGANRVGLAVGKPVWRVGLARDADLRISEVERNDTGSSARLRLPDGRTFLLDLAVPGLHNIRNAAMAVGVVHAFGEDPARAIGALREYSGVERRFEVLGTNRGVTVVDDYAHHSTEVAVTLAAARQRFPGRRLVVVFQPHLFSRTRDQAPALGIVLSTADLVVVTDIYPAREKPIRGVTGKLVAKAAMSAGAPVEWVQDVADLPDKLSEMVRDGDVVLTLGAGDITNVGNQLLTRLAGAAA
jgi:UDP-N-acetylmuramate--alanine ligase